jgi:epoxyqueuosine reductase
MSQPSLPHPAAQTDGPTLALRDRARALGFHRVGIARATELPADHARYMAFIAAGRHGAMTYLAENPEARRRVDSPAILENARSVVVCALAYHRDETLPLPLPLPLPLALGTPTSPPSPPPEDLTSGIARYARGRDYHNFMRRRLRKLADWIRRELGAEARPIVDTAPVLERAWARQSGVGFVGKNGCVIIPGIGSYVLLGEVVTTADLPPDEPMESRCGDCVRCLERCPTGAFTAAYELDPRRCISYLTIELSGEIPEEFRAPMGGRFFGCDVCQEVCPYNRTEAPPSASTRDFAPDARWSGLTLASLVTMTEDQHVALTRGTPLARPGRDGLARNAAIALGNVGSRRHLPVLHETAGSHPSQVVRAAAGWAIATIQQRTRET